jgi:hypothetical protein
MGFAPVAPLLRRIEAAPVCEVKFPHPAVAMAAGGRFGYA